ncbi:MAG: ABC transporter permease [Planctomycetes bacterium]|nr:ABC transporter permease [Planctomycetota bacterium]
MPWKEVIRRLLKRPIVLVCLVVITLFALMAANARLLVHDEDLAARTSESALDETTGLERSYHPPGWLLYLDESHGHWANTGVDAATREERPAVAPENRNWGFFDARTWHLPLGCDIHGVSLLAKLVRGTELAFIIGIVPTLISSVIAVFMGLMAGYFGKLLDDAIGYMINTLASVPFVLLLIAFIQAVRDSEAIAEAFSSIGWDSKPMRNLVLVLVVIGLTSWIGLCRLVRAEVLKHKDRDYVHAARALGCGHARIIGRHILPNVMHLVIIMFTLSFVGSVALEVFLSFVNIGIDSTLPTWGQVIVKGRDELQRDPSVWWPLTFASLTLFVLSLAFSLTGDALRDALDPKLRT